MRNPFAKVIVASMAVLTLWSAVAQAQGRGGRGPAGFCRRRGSRDAQSRPALLPSRI